MEQGISVQHQTGRDRPRKVRNLPNVTLSVSPHNHIHTHKSQFNPPTSAKMLSMTMRSAAAQALRACARGLPTKSSLTSRVGRSILVAPGQEARVAARGYATATAKKTTAAAKKPAAKKTTAAAKKSATKKTAAKKPAAKKAAAKKPKKAVAKKPKKVAAKKRPVNPERQKLLLKRELKKTALLHQEPKNLPASAWLIFTSNGIKSDGTINGPATLGPKMASLAVEFRNLSPTERQVCNTIGPPELRDPY